MVRFVLKHGPFYPERGPFFPGSGPFCLWSVLSNVCYGRVIISGIPGIHVPVFKGVHRFEIV